MFGLGKAISSQPLSCLLTHNGYALVGLAENESIRFCEEHYFAEPSPALIAKCLADDVNKYRLAGRSCQVILAPGLYQLLLVDAPNVPENELPKALRWQLKGLIDYPLNDIVIDAFIVPPHGAGGKRAKAFAAVTLQSALTRKVSIIESCLLHPSAVSISELALSKLLSVGSMHKDAPCIVISYDNDICQHHVYFKGDLYLLRNLVMSKTITQPNSTANYDMLLEIQRSIDYCLMELKLAEPKQIFFTPSFYNAATLFPYLQTELNKEVNLLDVNSFFTSESLNPEITAKVFYALGGALMLLNEKNES